MTVISDCVTSGVSVGRRRWESQGSMGNVSSKLRD